MQEIAGIAAGMVEVPSGGNGAEPTRADELIASGIIATGSSGLVETGMTWGQLKAYREFALMIVSVGGNVNFSTNSGFRIRATTIFDYWALPPVGTFSTSHSGAIFRVRFADDAKTLYSVENLFGTAYQIRSSVAYAEESLLNYRSTGYNGAWNAGIGYVDLTKNAAGCPDTSPICVYSGSTETTCEYEWKAIGVFK